MPLSSTLLDSMHLIENLGPNLLLVYSYLVIKSLESDIIEDIYSYFFCLINNLFRTREFN